MVALFVASVALANSSDNDVVQSRLIVAADRWVPGSTTRAGVFFTVTSGWHLYWVNPGESGMAPQVEWRLPQGWEVRGPRWPTPRAFDGGGVIGYGYEDTLLLVYDVMVPEDADLSRSVTVGADVMWLACRDICVAGTAETDIRLPISSGPAARGPHYQRFLETERYYPSTNHDWTFAARRSDLQIKLFVEPGSEPRLRSSDEVRFYPSEPGLVSQSVRRHDGTEEPRLMVTMQAETDRHRSLNMLEGILSVSTESSGSQARALRISVPLEPQNPTGNK